MRSIKKNNTSSISLVIRAIVVIFFQTSLVLANAPDWKTFFYTDDSNYYLKITSDGFIQRFRIDNSVCKLLENAAIITASEKTFHFSPMAISNASQKWWGTLYGLNEKNYCWFVARAEGLDLNNQDDLRYVLHFKEYGKEDNYYFTEVTNSLLPINRFSKELDESGWIHLGAMGATPATGGGVYYKIWEPYADEVHLFINESISPISLTPNSELNNPRRFHSIYLKNSKINDRYKYQFIKNGRYESLRVTNEINYDATKIDPMAKKIEYDTKGGKYNGYLNPRAIVTSNSNYKWNSDHIISNYHTLDYNNWIIYQLWPLAFNPQKKSGHYLSGTYDDINEKLDYLTTLGITAIEFLPLNENRFYASWGYAPDSLLLTQPKYGTPDELKNLIDSSHSRGIKIIFDIVINHINNSLIRDPLSSTVSKSKFYDGNTPWGPKPRYEMIMVQKWLADSIIAQAMDYHVDGIRVDMTKQIYENSATGYNFLQELNHLLKTVHPSIYLVAEDLPNNIWTTTPQSEGGIGFDSQWNDKFKNFFEYNLSFYRQNHRQVNLSSLAEALKGLSNHWDSNQALSFGSPLFTVNYLGSHDFIGNKNPILRIVSDYSSLEWDVEQSFARVRPLADPFNTIENFRLIHNEFTHSVGKLSYAILFTKPGSILFFQGEELASDINIENEWSYLGTGPQIFFPSKNIDLDRYVGHHKMPWEFLSPETSSQLSFLTNYEKKLFSGYHNFFKRMIDFKLQNPELNSAHAFNVAITNNSILTYQVSAGKKEYFVVANFGDDLLDLSINFPSTNSHQGMWRELINSSHTAYGGSSNLFQNSINFEGGKINPIKMKGTSISIFINHL